MKTLTRTTFTIVANAMVRRLPAGWAVKVVDPSDTHLYQPGLLFLPFGAQDEDKMTRPRGRTLASSVEWIEKTVGHLDHEKRTVQLSDGEKLSYQPGRCPFRPACRWPASSVSTSR